MKKHRRDILTLAEKYRGSAEPACEHFRECGGCLFQDISYDLQLALKLEYLNSLFSDIARIEEIVPSAPYGYRNRMDFVTAFGKIGLRKAKRYRHVIDIRACAIMQEKSNTLFQKLRCLVSGIEDYDYVHHNGYLRYIVVRQGYFSGQTMVNFVTAIPEDRLSPFIGAVVNEADSSSLLYNDSFADTSFGNEYSTLKRGYITEVFDGIRYHITPNAFFQSNSPVARELYRRVKKIAAGKSILDLFCGAGTIGLFIADAASRVTGVEISPESIAAAEENRMMNNIGNVQFVCGDARQFLSENTIGCDTVIIDPPRGGLHPKSVRLLAERAPGRIAYISCNPPLLKEDLTILHNYSIESITAFDMFPQTPHIELLALLCRK